MPSPSLSVRIEMRSSGSRCGIGLSEPASFHGAVFCVRRPLGYSGVSQAQSRPFSSQSTFLTVLISGYEATSQTLNSG